MKPIFLFLLISLVFCCATNPYLPENYKEQYVAEYGSEEAELVVRFGDMDNLGFGWPLNYDPFSGRSSNIHDFPWYPKNNDLYYTDRILVISGYSGGGWGDGYSKEKFKSQTKPGEILLEFKPPKFKIKRVILQIFVDDFQAPTYGVEYQVKINGIRVYELEDIINSLNQGGPIGKLITCELPEYIVKTISDGKLVLYIDDPVTNAGEGFAFDFFRLLVNPKQLKNLGSLSGMVYDGNTRKQLAKAIISVDKNSMQTSTDQQGKYLLQNIVAGLKVIKVSMAGYKDMIYTLDIIKDTRSTHDFYLMPDESLETKYAEIKKSKKGDLLVFNDIVFYADSDVIKSESYPLLDKISQALLERKDIQIELRGFTNNVGRPGAELALSQKRAQRVADYLIKTGVVEQRIKVTGLGSQRLKQDQITEANRRVEIMILQAQE
jgi:OOP family OmpA-OmpF porin